jgi:SAM-dependent methyltransferase
MATQKDVEAGQAVYTPWLLALPYDILVLGISNTLLWKCPTRRLLAMYDAHISANHLDVGVGSGYFLAHCRFPSPTPRLALMDLNPHSLERAAQRAARYTPERYQHNVLEPAPAGIRPFDSIGMNYLLHCVPGAIEEKAVAFDNLRPLLNPGGCFFGATLLQGDTPRSRPAQLLMKAYNRRGMFHNAQDTPRGLERALKRRFRDFRIEREGCAALFWARGPKEGGRARVEPRARL